WTHCRAASRSGKTVKFLFSTTFLILATTQITGGQSSKYIQSSLVWRIRFYQLSFSAVHRFFHRKSMNI
ncbi:hypothetical protein L9F63_022751, partial [Diploptera punctata]